MLIHGFIIHHQDFKVRSISGNNFVLLTSDIDKSSIKVGDEVEILFRNEENIAGTGVVAKCKSINSNN